MASPSRRSFLLLIGSLALFGCQLAPPSATEPASTAVQWQRWEGALTAQRPPAQPYAGVSIDVRFTGPGDATFQVPTFWDGERGFRFRAAFPAPGLWRWVTTSNDVTDTGLHGRTGAVRVTAYSGENALYRHGDLRVSDDRRHLAHADGTPFLWIGDTGWNATWKGTAADWQHYVDTRARQRFSVLQVVVTGVQPRHSTPQPASGHAPFLADRRPNPLFWRDLEDKIAAANDRGLIVLLNGVGNAPAGFGAAQRPPAFARYLAGRLAGHLVIFSPSMDQRYDAQNDEAGARLRALTTHLVTQHPGTHFETAKRYHDAGYADFSGLQTGHHAGNLARAYSAARDWTLELWQRPPIKPVINIEAMYDALGSDQGPAWREQDARKLGWITWLAGSRGYTYGAGDVPPKVPAGAGGVWRFNTDPAGYDYWRKALAWPSAGQMTHLRDFFAGIAWWRLEPTPDLVRNQVDDVTRKFAVSRSAAGDLLVAYLPENTEIALDLRGMAAGLTGRWFNPVTGRSVAVTESLAPNPHVTLRRPAAWSDAVLLLRRP